VNVTPWHSPMPGYKARLLLHPHSLKVNIQLLTPHPSLAQEQDRTTEKLGHLKTSYLHNSLSTEKSPDPNTTLIARDFLERMGRLGWYAALAKAMLVRLEQNVSSCRLFCWRGSPTAKTAIRVCLGFGCFFLKKKQPICSSTCFNTDTETIHASGRD